MPKIVDHQQRRSEITAVAARHISDNGIEALTFRELARATGYSKGIIEHYFDDKADLVSASLDWANHRYYERADAAVKDKTGLAAVEARLLSTLPMNADIRLEWKIRLVFWSMACFDAALNDEQRSRVDKTTRHFVEEFKVAVNQGDMQPAGNLHSVAQRLVFTISGLSCAAVHNPDEYTPRRLKREVRHIIEELQRG